eukprot:7267409-Ditylum_brightwellii.AAC.1
MGHQILVEEEDLISILKEEIKVFLVSDRGEVDGIGYFGWVIGTHTEELVHHKGHVAGNPNLIESLWSERIGALSLLYFMLRFCINHNIKMHTELWSHYCNNNTTDQRIQWYQARTILNPTYTLAADYDVHAQLEATIKQMQDKCNSTTWNIQH